MESNLKKATKREAGGLCASVWRGMLLFMLLLLPGGWLWAQDGWKAQETNPQNYLYWVNGVGYSIDGTSGTAKVVESAKDLQGDVSLPSALTITRSKDGAEFSNHSYRVTAIGEKAFAERSSIVSIFLGSEVTDIEGEAFKGCSQLKKVIYVGASAPDVAAGAFEKAGVRGVEAAAGGEIVFTTPTGYGKLNATLNGKLIGSGTPAEKGELVVTATAAEHYMVASNSRRGGAYTASEVGVTIDGNAVAASEVELDRESRSVTVKLQLDGTIGKRVEVAFMPQMVKVDYGVLQSQARVFAKTNSRSSELHYENGGTLLASVGSGEEVEYGARVDYTAKPGDGATLPVDWWGDTVWAVESWRVGGEKVAGANGTSFSRLADGQQVQVRFKRTKFLIRCKFWNSQTNSIDFGENGQIRYGIQKWYKEKTHGVFEVVGIGITANGVWIRGKDYELTEDTYIDVFYPESKSTLLKVVQGLGSLIVKDADENEAEQGKSLQVGTVVTVTAKPEGKSRLRSLAFRGVPVPIADPKAETSTTIMVPNEDAFRVFATFAENDKQIVTIAEEGLCAVTVKRNGRELRNGDEVRPGDHLTIESKLIITESGSQRYDFVSLSVNGTKFVSGDEYIVGDDDVNISSIASWHYASSQRPSYLSYQVFGPGKLSFGNLAAGSKIYSFSGFTPTATPDSDARLVRLTANGKKIESEQPFSGFEDGEDVYVEAVFAKSGAYVCLQKVTAGDGYIEVLRHGDKLRPGEPVVAGEQLTIVAKPSVSAGAKSELKLLTVNGVPWESGREYTVPDDQDVSVEAIFGSMDDHMVLLSQRGEGVVTLRRARVGAGYESATFPHIAKPGESFEVNVMPTSGWELGSLYWGDQAIASGASGLLVGDDDITVFAHFVDQKSKAQQHLYLPIVPGGKVVVTRDGKSLGSAAKIAKGEKLTITAQPESGYRVVGPIYVNGEPFVGTQYKVPVKGNVEVKASFAKLGDVILSLVNVGKGVLQAEQGGKVVRHGGVIGTRDGGGSVTVEKDVIVRAKPGKDQQLVSLTVDGKSVNATESNGLFTYTIDAALIKDDVTVRAVFGPEGEQVLTIDVEGNAGGSVKVYKEDQAGGKEYLNSGSVVSGATLSFEVEAAEGWTSTEFSVNGTKHDPSKTFQVGSENVRVRATFKKIDYTLSVETLPADGSRGTVTVKLAGVAVNNDVKIHIGDRLEVTTKPELGNEVKGVSVTGAKQVDAVEYEVLRDTKVAVTFGKKGKPVLFVDVQPSAAAGKVEVLDAAGVPVEAGTELTKGAQLKVTSTPAKDYKLAQLTLNGVGIHSPESITVGDEVKIVAYFEKETPGSRLGLYRLIEGGGKGTVKVTRNGDPVYDGAETLCAGDELNITATPDEGSRFVTLQVNGVEVSNPRVGYVVQGAVAVKAVFARDGEYAMSIAESGPGRVKVRRNGQILLGGEPVKTDDRLEITAVPDANAHTSSLTVDGQPFVSGQSVKVTNHDVRIEAAFAADSAPMVLTLRSTRGGELRVIREGRVLEQNEKLAKDDKLTVVAKPDGGYQLVLLLVNGKQQASGYVHTVAEGESVTVEARFAKNDTKTLQLLPMVGGMLVAKDRGTNAELVSNAELHEGQNIDIIATANPGSRIKEIKINGDSHPATAAEKEEQTVGYTVTAADKTVIVEGIFEQKEYQLNAIALGGDGTGKVVVTRKGVELTPGSSKVRYGEELKIAVTPTDGKCEGVWVNDVRLAGESPYQYQVGTSDVTIRVLFVKDGITKIWYTYEVRKEGGAKGSLTVTKKGETQPLAFGAELERGVELHIKAAAESGSYLSSLTVNEEEQDVKATEVVWTVPKTVAGGAVNVVAEFLPVGQQKLEVLANGPGEVRVTSMDGLKLYQNGSLVSEDTRLLVTVNPNAGSICKLLTINGAAQKLVNNQVSFTVVKEGAKIWAEFGSSAEYKLYYQNPVVGIITVTDVTRNSKLESGAVLTKGHKLRIEAAPRLVGSYALKELKVNGEAKASGVEVEVEDKDVLVEALFAKAWRLTVTVNPTAVGSDKVVVKDATSDQVLSDWVAEGQKIKIEATAVPGYDQPAPTVAVLSGLEGPVDEVYTVKADVQVKVTYTPNRYTLEKNPRANAPAGAGYSVVEKGKNDELSEVYYGQAIEVQVTPVNGYTHEVTVEGASKEQDGSYTVKGAVKVTVTYTAKEYTLTVKVEGNPSNGGATVKVGGTVPLTLSEGVKGTATVKYGDELTVEPVEVAGYNAVVSPASPITVADDVNVKVSYTAKEYTLTVTVEGNPNNGGATVTVGGAALTLSEGAKGTATVKYGDELTVEPVEVAGYSAVVSPASPITVAGDVNVKVSYTAGKRGWKAPVVEPAALSGMGGVTVTDDHGTALDVNGLVTAQKIKIEATAVAGYDQAAPTVAVLSGLEGPVAGVYTVKADGDVQVKVTYSPNRYTLEKNPIANAPAGASYSVVEKGKSDELSEVYHGQAIEVQVTPVNGYTPEVTVEGASKEQDGSYIVTGAVKVTVTYMPKEYTLTVVKVGVRKEAGEVLVNGRSEESSVSVEYGAKVKVSAAAKQGEEKVTVERMQIGDKVYYSGEEQEVTVTGDLTVTVNFGDVERLTLATSVVPEGTGKVTVKAERNGGEVELSENDELVAGERLTISAEGQRVPDLQQPGKEVQYRLQVIKVNGAAYTSHDLPLLIKVTKKVVIEAQFVPENVSANEVRLVTSVKGSGKGKVEVKRNGEPKPLAEWSVLRKGDVLEVAATPDGMDELLSLNVSGEERQNGGEYIVTGVEPDGVVKVEATFVKAGKLGFSVTSGANGRVEVWRDGKRLAHDAELTKGEKLTITAVPLPGYVCTRLEVDGMPFVGGDEYTVEYSFKVYAEFGEAEKQLLVVDCGAHGSVKVMRGSDEVKSSGTVQQGDELTITATPASAEYELSVLTVNDEDKAPSPATYTVGAESRVEVKARFRTLKAGVKSVVILSSDGGRVEAHDANGTRYRDGDEVQVGVKLTVTAEASRGYRLEKLTVNAEEAQAGSVEYTVADGDKEVLISAVFTRVPYKLEVVKKGDAEADGEVAVKVNGKDVMAPYTGVSLYRGDAVEFVPSSANSDVECASVNVNGRAMRTQPYVYTVVDSDVKAVLVFTNKNVDPKPVYLFTDVPNGHGTLVIDGEATKDIKNGDAVNVAEEKVLTLTAAPETGYKLDRLTVNGERVESGATWQIPSGVEKIEVVAEFVQENVYRLTIAKFGDGEVTVASKENPTVTYSDGDWLREGQELVVTAKAEGTNKVKALTINGKLVEGAGSSVSGEYTVAKEDVKVQAAFGAANEYMLIVACGQEGKVVVTDADGNTLQPMAKLTEGQKLKVTAEATATGYGLKRLMVNGESVVSGRELEVKSDVVVMAEFARAYRLSIAVTPQELTEHVAVKNAEGQALRDGDEIFLGDAISVNVEDVNGYKVERKVDGVNEEASGQWVVTGNVKVDVAYEKVLHEIVVELMDEAGQPIQGAAVQVAGYEVIEAGNGDYTVQLPDGSYKVTAKKEGYEDAELDVTVAGEDQNVKLTLRLKEKTAVESVLLSAVTLTPNPASVAIRLLNAEAAKSYAVYTLRGVEVMRGVLAGESMVAIDVTSLADGVYLLRVDAADGARVLHFVVAR